MSSKLLKKALLISFIVLLCIPSNLYLIQANETVEEASPSIVQLQPDSNWQGTVFGDVGGQDKITDANFTIHESEDGELTLRSMNDRGKISSSTDGIAYLYQELAEEDLSKDFEFTTTATIQSIASNNQASFGIMLRNTVYDHIHSSDVAKDDYLAVGALDQRMKIFSRQEGTLSKLDGDTALSIPAADVSYTLSVKRTSGIYTIAIDDYSIIQQYTSPVTYIGIFTARNASVTFTNTSLQFEEDNIPIPELQFYAFGGNTSAEKNPEPLQTEDGYVLETSGGKIASGDEGLSLLAYQLPLQTNFKLKATANVLSFNETGSISTPNQKSFGLMIRDHVGEHYSSATTTANYVAVGALDQVMKGFYKQGVVNQAGGTQTKLNSINQVNAPATNERYELEIEKNGASYTVSVNGHSSIIEEAALIGEYVYAGIYVARDARVEFSELNVEIASTTVTRLELDADEVKRNYRLQEELDLTGLVVRAVLSNDQVIELTESDYIVTGFDSSTLGSKQLTIHYRGVTAELDYEVKALQLTELTILYEPIKTSYYIGDRLELQGLKVEANYESGYLITELDPSEYEIRVENQTYDGNGLNLDGEEHIFTAPGNYQIGINVIDHEEVTAFFEVEVVEAEITNLEITKLPNKTTYFIGESLSLDGIIVYANYDDSSKVRIRSSELQASGLDTSISGTATITITYRNGSAAFNVTVKEKQASELTITQYPKSTYTVGEELDFSNLSVAITYDNGDQQLLAANQYTLDSSAVNVNVAGQYAVILTSTELDLPQQTFIVTVREAQPIEWSSIRFGQSTSNSNNTITVDEEGVVTLKAVGGSAGKVTGDHDGISFYYVELDAVEDNFELSADIKVIEYAKSPEHDGQESFGIMARDAIGTANDSSVFASNIAAIGGYSGGTRNANGTQLFARTGIESPDGSGSQGIKAVMLQQERPSLNNTHPVKPYRLTLSKTNSGFVGQINDEESQLIYTDDIMNVQDQKMYVGFYTARLATIEVHNIELKLTAAASDAPRVEPPQQPITPTLNMVSLLETSETSNYQLRLVTNSSGTLTVKQGNHIIVQEQSVAAHSIFSYPAPLTLGSNRFSIQFIPNETELLTNYEPIVLNRTVTVKSYDGDIYVSPEGTTQGAGTIDAPIDLDTAVTYVSPGQTIIVLDGHYKRSSKLEIKKYNDGTAEAMKTLRAAEGTRPVIDFDKKSEGVVLSGNYWHIIGLDFARSANNTKGFTVGGSYNTIELVHLYEHGDTGLQISRTDQSTHIDDWPSYNLILNSTSFANRDPSNNNADGFAAKLTSGVGNVFRGCIAHHNIDDGWDLYTKAGSGAIGAVLIEDSIAYSNGFQLGGTELMGDGNGFKLGGEGIHVPHEIRNSIAFNNGTVGFTSNSNPGVIAHNNIGFNNGKGNIVFTTYGGITSDFTISGFISFGTAAIPRDQVPSTAITNSNYFNDGTAYKNGAGITLSEDNFKSLVMPEQFERNEDGSIILGDFLSFIEPNIPRPTTGPSPTANPTSPSETATPAPASPADKLELKVQGSLQDGTVRVALSEEQVEAILKHSEENTTLQPISIIIEDPATETTNQYSLTVPASLLSQPEFRAELLISTPIGGIKLSSQLLSELYNEQASDITVQIKHIQDDALASSINSDGIARPIVSYTLNASGKQLLVEDQPTITLYIPYNATEEKGDPRKLSIVYIDNSGELTPISNAYYDETTGYIVGRTNHLSSYAVVLREKGFVDVSSEHWAAEAISILAAKGIVNGINNNEFAPNDTVTRAQYITMLMRAFGITTRNHKPSSFTDVPSAYYAAETISIGEQLGIVSGYPDGSFKPSVAITRQEMFVMTYRALQHVDFIKLQSVSTDLIDRYTDGDEVGAFARIPIAAFIERSWITGSANSLFPLRTASRAEAAVFLERIISSRYEKSLDFN